MKSRNLTIRLWILLVTFLLVSCQPAPTVPPPTQTPTAAPADTDTPAPTLTPTNSAVYFPQVDLQPTATPMHVVISLPVAMINPTQTPTPVWVPVKNGQVYAPILIYHHVTDGKPGGRYTVKIQAFKDQMQALRDKGYTAITITTLVDALHANGKLPPKPVVITFDDGNLDVYQNAFPIMRSFGFPGVFYIVSTYLKAENYVNVDQLKEMMAAGWEVGSHSRTHADFSKDATDLDVEISQSRDELQAALNVPIETFAYPFADGNEHAFKKALAYGYSSAVCSGWTNLQSLDKRYCLPRREVKNATVMEEFLKLIAIP